MSGIWQPCSQALLWKLSAAFCRFSAVQAGRADDDATALTSSPHGPIKHRGRGRDLAALQEQVIAKLGRQVHHSCACPKVYVVLKDGNTVLLVAIEAPHRYCWDALLLGCPPPGTPSRMSFPSSSPKHARRDLLYLVPLTD